MAKEICISSTPHETRLAILEDDQLSEIYYERENEYTLAGSIYKGKVTRVLPGMQSAFVDIGLDRDAFLYVTDFLEMEDPEDTEEIERAATQGTPIPQPALSEQSRLEAPASHLARPAADAVDAEFESSLESSFGSPAAARPESRTGSRSEAGADGGRGDGRRSDGRRGDGRRGRRGESREAGPSREASPAREVSQERDSSSALPEPAPFQLEGEFFQARGSESVASRGPQSDARPETRPDTRRRPQGEPSRPAARAARVPETVERETFELETFNLESVEPETIELETVAPYAAEVGTAGLDTAEDAVDEQGARLWRGRRRRQPGAVGDLPDSRSGSRSASESRSDSRSGSRSSSRSGSARSSSRGGRERNAGDAYPAPVSVEASAQGQEESSAGGRRSSSAPAAFVLPGESLSRYGAASSAAETASPAASPASSPAAATPAAAPRAAKPAASAVKLPKPLTLVDDEIAWDGSGLLPGESLARHRKSSERAASPATTESEPEENASASHNVDPLPPVEFRLKDIFGGRKKDVPAEPAAKPKTARGGSSYAPGSGPLEEELIEEEEYESHTLRAQRRDDHDHEDLEEETKTATGGRGGRQAGGQRDDRVIFESGGYDGEDEGSSAGSAAAPSRGRGRGRGRDGREGQASREGQPGRDAQPSREGRSSRDSRGGRDGRSSGGDRGGRPSRRSAQTQSLPIISDLLKPGQEILVQIAKEPIAKKGARITSHIALPGRFLVFMPTVSHVGVSRRIDSDEERQRLKRILVSERGEATGGFIVRTAAEGASEEELRADLRFLINLWNEIRNRAESSKPPALIYHDLNLIERILRDQVSDDFAQIWVDSEADYERIVRFLGRFSPDLVRRVKLYTKQVPLFEHFGIQDEISKALRSKVWLKSGGSIVINQTEALVAIDINTGKFVGKTARLEDTILRTNLDAIPEIVRQIRLRDLGGIIVIDFIDMDERRNRARVMTALEEALKNDKAPTKVLQFNDFGLVAITRKRVKQSLERTLSVPCPTCQATGMVKSPVTVANEIYIEMRKMRKHFDQPEVMLRVHAETVKVLKADNARWLADLEELAGRNVLVKSDNTLHPEQFDIQG